ncbi:MAG: hypothetical protein ACXAEX_21740 [Promethearchaeota archaeon]|jgi:hypothetical protein
MVYVVITAWWPNPRGPEVTAKWNELLPQFNAATKSIQMWFKSTRIGIQATGYYEIEAGKLEESLTALQGLAMEFTAIDGYMFEIETQISMEEALAAQAAQG